MKQAMLVLSLLLSLSLFAVHEPDETAATQGGGADDAPAQSAAPVESDTPSEESASVKILITAGDTVFTAIPEENTSAEAFIALLQEGPLTVSMSDYAGMEKVGPLGTDLPRNDTQMTVGAGDVILYQGNQITIYYGTNAWRFTKLAEIEGASEETLLDALGSGDIDVTFSLAQ